VRAVFVNHCHPDCPHVCGTRAREFASALARRGDRIVLLTETLRRDDEALDPKELTRALAAHDWSAPFRLAVRPRPAPVLEALRAGRMPAPLRAIVIAYQYLLRGGMFTDWRDASEPYWQPLVSGFHPDVVWGVFGNTDAWAIAQGIARQARCPWVRDIKDQWTKFIPASFQRIIAARYADAAATTGLSRANLDDTAGAFPGAATVIYSGVPVAAGTPATVPETPFGVTLVGTVYDKQHLASVAEGLRQFAAGLERNAVRVSYVGTDVDAIRGVFAKAKVPVEILGQLPFVEYWRVIAASHVNVYLRANAHGWWHHKIVELLAVGRPILCCPGEIDEARTLAASVGGTLEEAPNAAAVAAALERLRRHQLIRPSGAAAAALSWDARAQALSGVLQAAAQAR
jgi:glycosyltransferase involved in cell wall biosynthesis